MLLMLLLLLTPASHRVERVPAVHFVIVGEDLVEVLGGGERKGLLTQHHVLLAYDHGLDEELRAVLQVLDLRALRVLVYQDFVVEDRVAAAAAELLAGEVGGRAATRRTQLRALALRLV